ncbi:MAG: DUF2071 domain-containing protein [Pirellulales bacterium]|nr:DUF2071 domain-containing protein [Pirellulales bacterium]
MPGVFLTAEWRQLLMLNYEIEPALLLPLVPRGTQLDLWQGRAFVSVVGFNFLKTRVCGMPIPGHSNFPEVNLRLYVVRRHGDQLRRGVVFVRELVPRWAVALVARACYEEKYWTVPLQSEISPTGEPIGPGAVLAYRWRLAGQRHHIKARCNGHFRQLAPDSHEAFIAEHYWAYTALRSGSTAEYRVEHAPWRVAPVDNVELKADITALYGSQFVEALREAPVSAFVAEGSPVLVRWGMRLEVTRDAERDLVPLSLADR